MEEWKEYKLGEVLCEKGYIRGPFGSALKRGDMLNEGIPVYEQQHAIYGKRDFRYYISKDKYDEMKRFTVYPGDIIISCSGTIGEVSIIKEEDPKGIISQALLLLRSKKEVVMPEFLLYFFRTPQGHNSITSRSSGSVQVNIARRDVIEQIPLYLPHRKMQNRIVSILKSLDDKIEVNKRMNDNLEQQAQALFKSWFVDFEPFRDQPFVESELGMIPQGWRVIQLIDIAEIYKNSINPQKQPQTIFNHYSIPAFDEGMKPEIQLGEEIKSNKFVITNKITLFSKLNPRIKRVWYVDNLNSNSICSTEFVPYKAKDESQSSFLYSLINSQGFYDYVMSMVNGATGSHQRFHPEESLNYRIAFSYECVSKYCEVMSPIIHQMLEKREESRRLAELRDTLLPRLMSGEIKVGDVTL